MSAFCLISTKKLKENQRRFLLNNRISVIDADFIQTKEIPAQVPEPDTHIIITSQKAAEIIIVKKILSPRHQILCVGPQTANILTAAGLQVVDCRDYGADLAQLILEKYSHCSFTFFCGTSRMDTLPKALHEAGISCREIAVYETISTPVKIDRKADGILFFSPSAVTSYLTLNTIGKTPCFCIGTTTASALESQDGPVIIAARPSVENVIVQAIKYYNNFES